MAGAQPLDFYPCSTTHVSCEASRRPFTTPIPRASNGIVAEMPWFLCVYTSTSNIWFCTGTCSKTAVDCSGLSPFSASKLRPTGGVYSYSAPIQMLTIYAANVYASTLESIDCDVPLQMLHRCLCGRSLLVI